MTTIFFRTKSLLEWAITIVLAMGFASVYVHYSTLIYNLYNICIFLLLLSVATLSFGYLIAKHQVRVTSLLMILGYYLCFLMPFALFNNRLYAMGILFILQMSVVPLLFFYFDLCNLLGTPWRLLQRLCRVISVIAGISLICWLVFSICRIGSPTQYLQIDWGASRKIPAFWGIYFETQSIKVFGNEVIRNSGIYAEAPMFSFILSFNLVSRLFILKQHLIHNIVLVLAMLSTLTTTATLILLIAGFATLLLKINDGWLLTISLLVVGMVVAMTVYFVLTQKFSAGDSLKIRLDDIQAGIKDWYRHPLTGNGIGNFESLINEMNPARTQFATTAEIGYSSGFFQVLALGGLALAGFYTLPMVAFAIKQRHVLGIGAALLSGVMMLLFINAIVSYEWLFLVIISYLYAFSFLTLKQEERL